MPSAFETYFDALKTVYPGGTEHSGRTALENLLNALKPEGVRVLHEPKREQGFGAPDFKVMRGARTLGYIENKAPGENLDKVLKSEQIKKYKALSDNLVLTDYMQWLWIRGGKLIAREVLAYASDLEDPGFAPPAGKCRRVAVLLAKFFAIQPEPVSDVGILAELLAVRARYLRDALTIALVRQQKNKTGGKLAGLYGVFKAQVFHELSVREFAGAFAQTLAYALFLARFNAGSGQIIDLHNVKKFIPTSFRLIRELADFLDEMENPEYAGVKWLIDEILSLINGLDLPAIHESLSFRHRTVRRGVRARDEEEARLFEKDPYIYFYEDFLSRYDPKERETRGVYYTPPPVVNFIVRAIDDVLKDGFALPNGLADHDRVTVLDFACGTGTFLVEVFERIFDNIGGAGSGVAGKYVRDHLLKHIYGFEFLLAPYTIAHLKLSQYLADKGHALRDDERLGVYLTNTLEPIEPQPTLFLPELSREVKLAQEVKDKPILVITGNPPYSGHSKNKGAWIARSIDAYKMVDGKPLGEKNPKWLNDDYVKFIRFAQMKMDTVDDGVVGIITNHSWLDNPTFRGMRRSLMETFDAIYVFDLHGNAKKRETAPDGSADMNVFDIQQGVAISIFVKGGGISSVIPSKDGIQSGPRQSDGKPALDSGVRRNDGKKQPAKIFHADLWGKRLAKYQACAGGALANVDWRELDPVSPFYLFIPQDRDLWEEYEKGWKVTDIFQRDVLGFQTHRDHFAIGFTRADIEQRIQDLRDESLSGARLREKYKLKDNRDWQLSKAREKLQHIDQPFSRIIQCAYRPFDKRWCYFGYETMDYPRRDLLDHVAWRENVSLNIVRQTKEWDWRHALISDAPAPPTYVEMKDGSYLFPLYLYPDADSGVRVENLSPQFRDWLDRRYDHHYAPEEIIGYLYAVLHSPAYRQRYGAFLRIDFPRIAFAAKAADFEALSQLGWQLIEAHLLRAVPASGLARPHGHGDFAVATPRWAAQGDRLYINKDQYFAPVPRAIWEFHIGGYQVLEKYLKSRKGRALTLDEITHIGKVADALAFTTTQMQAIDAAMAAAFAPQ